MPGCQRGVAAQFDLAHRSEPAQVVIGLAVAARHDEGGFAEIILRGDRLHQVVVEPALERHDGCRVAGQRTVGEGIDLEEWQARHVARSVISWGNIVSRSVCPSGSTWTSISVPGNRC